MNGFEARVALVTGAGSESGIGFAAARILGERGARVAIAATTGRIHARAAELAELGIEAEGFAADLTDADAAAGLVAAVRIVSGGWTSWSTTPAWCKPASRMSPGGSLIPVRGSGIR